MKRAAADDLYAALEKVIPDVRDRVEVEMVATPLTQRRFVRRHRGTYGPGIAMTRHSLYGADRAGAPTSVEDSGRWGIPYPGIGVPAAAATASSPPTRSCPCGRTSGSSRAEDWQNV